MTWGLMTSGRQKRAAGHRRRRAPHSNMTTKRLAEFDAHANQLELRLAELRDEFAAVQRESVSAAAIQRAVALFDSVWDMLLVPERFRILHLLLEAVVYGGATSEPHKPGGCGCPDRSACRGGGQRPRAQLDGLGRCPHLRDVGAQALRQRHTTGSTGLRTSTAPAAKLADPRTRKM
jgi:hypothetical protein